uniref:Plastid light harvesting protein n=1 Tax=Grammatophora oceanica TaxID=210454 RepID=A0A7S1YFH7_9STRA
MKSVIFSSLIIGAAAFAPSHTSRTTSALQADITSEVGAQAPLGYFDPAGIAGDPTAADQAEFDRRRYIELKHGRVAMLAVVGYLTTYAGVRFPGAEDIPAGFAALSAVPGMVWAQMIATWGMMEAANRDFTGLGEFPGDFRNGALDFGWDKQSDAWKKNKRSIELNNGRAAQMGIFGLMVHDLMGNVGDILPLAN